MIGLRGSSERVREELTFELLLLLLVELVEEGLSFCEVFLGQRALGEVSSQNRGRVRLFFGVFHAKETRYGAVCVVV